MSGIARILVAVKHLQGKSHPAILKAAQLARAFNAEMELFHCLATPVYTDVLSLSDRTVEEQEKELQAAQSSLLEGIAERLRLHGIRVAVKAEWDYPGYEAIIRRALQIKADLIVAGRYTGRRIAPRLLHSTDWELVRLSPIPALLVKNPHPYRRPAILAAVDPARAFGKPLALDRQILHLARLLSRGLHGTLHAVHAYSRMPTATIRTGIMRPPLFRQLEQRAMRVADVKFARALRSTKVAASRRYLIADDPVSAVMMASRKSHSAVVVMGSVARTGLKALLIGNSAERILDALDCDVLVVKPRGFRSRVPRAVRGANLVIREPLGIAGYN
jgi:universal stress protein E